MTFTLTINPSGPFRPGPADFTFFFERPRVGFVTSHPTVLNVFDRHAVYIANSS